MKRMMIKSVMHPFPFTIAGHQTLDVAQAMMSEHNIRHLPVKEGGKIAGILTDRDVDFALRVEKKNAMDLFVRDSYMPDPYSVPPSTPVYQVAATMAHMHIGCALVIDDEKLVGIFTTVDACRVLSEVLSGHTEQ